MASIQLQGLSKWFGDVAAVQDVDLNVRDGELLVLLGPSGCGKTTTLRCIAGLETPTAGEIYMNDTAMFSERSGASVPPKDRDIGFVFQNYALYPHMTVFNNVAFGLKVRKFDKNEIQDRVRAALRLVELEELAGRKPKQLSGGQQQRVAVARTLAMQPSYLLFDEPLANLDPTLRVTLRSELRRIHTAMGMTSLYVTHDQSEAMILGDRIAVMQHGRIVQLATGGELYKFPVNTFVAAFTGTPKTNLIPGEIHRAEDRVLLIPDDDPYCIVRLPGECGEFAGRRMIVHVRPEDLELLPQISRDEGAVTPAAVMPEGPDTLVHIQLGESGDNLIAKRNNEEVRGLRRGHTVQMHFRRGTLYDQETEQLTGCFGYDYSERPAALQYARVGAR